MEPTTKSQRITLISSQSTRRLPDWRELVAYRDLFYQLTRRALRIRYTQSVLGGGWVLVEPILSMVVFTIIFNRLLAVEAGQIPYPVFSFSGLVLWTYFVNSLTKITNSILTEQALVSKVYFPRLIVPLVAALAPIFDLIVALGVLVVLMLIFGVTPAPTIIFLPIFVIMTMFVSMSIGAWVAVLNVRYRDIGFGIASIVRIMVYAVPIAYATETIPEAWRELYRLNPLVVCIEGFRWALLGTPPPSIAGIIGGMSLILIILYYGLIFFEQAQRDMIDRL